MAMNVTFAETMVLKIVMDVANCHVGPFSNLTRLINESSLARGLPHTLLQRFHIYVGF